MQTAVFPGSFDPITNGHVDIIKKALPVFDKIIVGIGNNSTKNYMFDLSLRKAWIESVFANEKKIEVLSYHSLTVDLCTQTGASYIIRGLRSGMDFEFEKPIAHLNHALNKNIETVFFLASENYASISSSIIREIIRFKGDVSSFLPEQVRF